MFNLSEDFRQSDQSSPLQKLDSFCSPDLYLADGVNDYLTDLPEIELPVAKKIAYIRHSLSGPLNPYVFIEIPNVQLEPAEIGLYPEEKLWWTVRDSTGEVSILWYPSSESRIAFENEENDQYDPLSSYTVLIQQFVPTSDIGFSRIVTVSKEPFFKRPKSKRKDQIRLATSEPAWSF